MSTVVGDEKLISKDSLVVKNKSHDAITLDQLKSRSVTLRSRKSGKGLRVDFDDFPNLILWSTTNKSSCLKS
ncbi:hypothetical protein EfmAA610_31560 (plasmid) [Enterococcus faecium]|nr:hypothetical protein EfmAA610_31560 [Enterococcus faecium]